MFTSLLSRLDFDRARLLRITKESFWVLIGQGIGFIGSFVMVRVLTDYLAPAEYGKLSLVITIASLINQVVMGGIIAGVGRFYSIAHEKGDITNYFVDSLKLLSTATLVVLFLGFITFLATNYLFDYKIHGLLVWVVLYSLFSGYNISIRSIQNAARQRSIVAIHGGIEALLKIIVLTFIIFISLEKSIVVIIFGFTLAIALVTSSQIYFLWKLYKSNTVLKTFERKSNWIKQIWQYSWPFSVWGIFTWVQQVSDRWALERFTTLSEVGHYTVLYQLGYAPLVLITGVLVSFIEPILYQRVGRGNDKERNQSVHRLSWLICILTIIATIVLTVIIQFTHERLFKLLVSQEFRGNSYLLPWMVLSGGLFASAQILALKLMSELKTVSLLPVKIIPAILGLIANFVGAYYFGLVGVIASMLFFSIIYLISIVFILDARSI
jgi:O-antigen/teichoic acid export membrane protein